MAPSPLCPNKSYLDVLKKEAVVKRDFTRKEFTSDYSVPYSYLVVKYKQKNTWPGKSTLECNKLLIWYLLVTLGPLLSQTSLH